MKNTGIIEIILCFRCKGSGVGEYSWDFELNKKVPRDPCLACEGSGRLERTTTHYYKPVNTFKKEKVLRSTPLTAIKKSRKKKIPSPSKGLKDKKK